jgi:predicted Fe-Mo cluster-binding NifX family protein
MNSKPKISKVGIATIGKKGLEDSVSPKFGRSKTFTVLDIEGYKVKNIEVVQNPAVSLSHGRGAIISKYLADMNVKILISSEFGPNASVLLKELNMNIIIAKNGQRVIDVLRENNLIK